ncbi:MAG: hypothetical protein IT179_04285 [Acidobacteria bacterium]|nr:hypothetical protein [Acidobacteriota bacterium]
MEDHLKVVLPALAPALAGAPARAAVRDLASRLPPCPAGGFEIPLGPGSDRVDFHVLADRWTALGGRACAHDARWAGVAGIAEAWRAEGSPLASTIIALILEFDLGRAGAGTPAPCVFCALDPAAGEQPDVVRSVTAHLLGARAFGAVAHALDACLEALPAGAGINHVGAMGSRPGPALRINIGGLPPDLIAPVAARLGWAGHPSALSRIVDGIGAVVDSIEVAWDLGRDAPRRMGLECFLSDTGDPGTPRWPVVLDHLSGLASCDPAKVRALLEWPGLTRASAGQPWPAALHLPDRFLAGHATSVFVRRINHVKAVVEGDHVTGIKAYPIFGHRWLPRLASPG